MCNCGRNYNYMPMDNTWMFGNGMMGQQAITNRFAFNLTSPLEAQLRMNMNNGSYAAISAAHQMPTNNFFQLQQAREMGYQIGLRQALSNKIDSTAGQLEGLKSRLEAIAKDSQLDDSQKNRVLALVAKVEALQAELETLAKNPGNYTNEVVKMELEAIQGQMYELQADAAGLAKTISGELAIKNQDDATDETDVDDNEDGNVDGNVDITSSTRPSSSSNTENEVAITTAKEGLTLAYDANKEDYSEEVTGICENLSKAILGAGTDEKLLRSMTGVRTRGNNENQKETGLINKDNVLDVLSYWNAQYSQMGAYADDDGGLIESIYDEFNYPGGGHDEVNSIVNALQEKAKSMGTAVYAKVSPMFAYIKTELNATWNTKESTVANLVNEIHAILLTEQGNNPTPADKTQTTESADAAKKVAASNKELKYNFFTDFNDDLVNRNKEKVTKVPSRVQEVKDADGNITFKVRYNQKDYSAKTYRELVDAIRKENPDFQLENLK